MPDTVLNIDDAKYIDLADLSRQHGSELPAERYGGRMAPISRQLGASKLGYNVTEIAPGKRAFPFHCHRANEEMFFVIEGTGELRLGESRHPLRAGDIIGCPASGPEGAHQIINTGAVPLRILAVSTAIAPELCHYPDTGKFGVLDPDGAFAYMGKAGNSLDYWEGE
ncbi:cupin [Bordetella sp. H567]|uniref:cupin domain-containing protein n=1 Tax=Bordetella sp. H567 TaxID=1697043 RepID=UPI00081C90D5|nr:cupin domain-containing protein [Bordetella sp. H567]AOB32665.1 cupin [Bordetella sp. H567]